MFLKRFNFLILTFGLLVAFSQEVAAKMLELRVSGNDEYTRLVFDWGEETQYTVTKPDARTLSLSFAQKPEQLPDFSVITAQPAIDSVDYKGSVQDRLVLDLNLSKSADVRDFTIGSRILIDVFIPGSGSAQSTAPVQEKAEPSKSVESHQPKPAQTQEAPQKVVGHVSPPGEENLTKAKPTPVKIIPLDEPEVSGDVDLIEDHLITVSATKNFNMAAFMRLGHLWLVMNKIDRDVKPQIRGKQSHLMKPINVVRSDDGVAYLIPLKSFKRVHVQPEGGGLLWRFIVTDEPKELESDSLERDTSGDKNALVSDMPDANNILTFKDPEVGDTIKVITSLRSNNRVYKSSKFIDVEVLPAFVGAAILPKNDDVEISLNDPNGFTISKSGGTGLEMVGAKDFDINLNQAEIERVVQGNENRLFHFARWQSGGVEKLENTRKEIQLSMTQKDEDLVVEDLLQLAKIYLANNLPQEAYGYMGLASDKSRGLSSSKPFRLLQGAVNALAGRGFEALSDFQMSEYNNEPEYRLWKAYAYALTEDSQNAYQIMPETGDELLDYPRKIRHKMALQLAEVALRSGDLERTISYLHHIRRDREEASKQDLAALEYLEGALKHQEGAVEEATEIWKKLAEGSDRLYRAKAALSLVKVELDNETITGDYALEVLERKRYAWRGDGLETQINYTLGLLYIQKHQFKKGLELFRDTASLAIGREDRREVTAKMQDVFINIFTGRYKEDIKPVEAIAIFESFSELLPAGEVGDEVVSSFIENLIEVDLLNRAASVLENQIQHRFSGASKEKARLKLAKVFLLDKKPQKALDTISAANISVLASDKNLQEEALLLKARTLSDLGQSKEALTLIQNLENSDRVLALKANIAWQSANWPLAARFLEQRLEPRNIQPGSDLTDEEAQLILNLAIAHKLSGDGVALAALRDKYNSSMSLTNQSKLFRIVSRKAEDVGINDREEILNFVAEVDLFKDVLTDF